MYITEEEASKKMCCQARHEAAAQVDRNLMIFCVGSWCMAWRWESLRHPVGSKSRGVCGLAFDPAISDSLDEIVSALSDE